MAGQGYWMWMGESEYRILRLVNKKARLRPHHQATFICTEQVYSSLRSAGCGHILNQINVNRAAIFGLPFCIAVKVCSEQTETLCAATRCFPVTPPVPRYNGNSTSLHVQKSVLHFSKEGCDYENHYGGTSVDDVAPPVGG